MPDGPSPLFDREFREKLGRLRLLTRKPLPGRQHSERRSPRTGASLEFAEHRNYSGGDDPRTLDWNAYGRLDRLFVKLFHEEEDMQVLLLIDASASMRWKPDDASASRPSKYDQARRIAAALADIALSSLHRVSVCLFHGSVGARSGASRGQHNLHPLLRFLEHTPPPGALTDLEASLREVASSTRRRSLAVVLSDFFDPRGGSQSALSALLQRRFDVVAIQVLDPREIDPALRGDLLLIDDEDGSEARFTVSDAVLRRYRESVAGHNAALETFCRGKQIPFSRALATDPFDAVVAGLLRDRVLA
jgi:uncharacterized protein (DUF58 family)